MLITIQSKVNKYTNFLLALGLDVMVECSDEGSGCLAQMGRNEH